MYGTDFESIARVMPGRTRHEIKNKFNAEDRRNSQLINEFLFKPKPIGECYNILLYSFNPWMLIGDIVAVTDLEEAGRMTGKDLSGPPPEIRGLSAQDRMGSEPRTTAGKGSEADFIFDEDSGRISTAVKEAVESDAEAVRNEDGDGDDEDGDNENHAFAPLKQPPGTSIVERTESRSPSPLAPDDMFASLKRTSTEAM